MMESEQPDITKAALLIIVDRQLLVARTRGKDFFIPPGGKPEGAETIIQAGIREGEEELGITIQASDLKSVGVFSAPAAGQENRMLNMEGLLVKAYMGEPAPYSEVEELNLINSFNSPGLKLGTILEHDILPLLKERGLID